MVLFTHDVTHSIKKIPKVLMAKYCGFNAEHVNTASQNLVLRSKAYSAISVQDRGIVAVLSMSPADVTEPCTIHTKRQQ